MTEKYMQLCVDKGENKQTEIHPSLCTVCPSIHPPSFCAVCLSIHPPFPLCCLSICRSLTLHHLSILPSVLSVCPSIHPSLCSAHPSLCTVRLSTHGLPSPGYRSAFLSEKPGNPNPWRRAQSRALNTWSQHQQQSGQAHCQGPSCRMKWLDEVKL